MAKKKKRLPARWRDREPELLFQVRCDGKMHRIGLFGKQLVLIDHFQTFKQDQALCAIADKPITSMRCYEIMEAWKEVERSGSKFKPTKAESPLPGDTYDTRCALVSISKTVHRGRDSKTVCRSKVHSQLQRRQRRHHSDNYNYGDPRAHNLPRLREIKLHELMASLAARELKAGLRKRFGVALVRAVEARSDNAYKRVSWDHQLRLNFIEDYNNGSRCNGNSVVACFYTGNGLLDWVNEVHRRGIPSGLVDDYFILRANWYNESLAYARGQRILPNPAKEELIASDAVEGWLIKTPSFDGPTCRWVFQPHIKGLKSKFTNQ